jgi:ribosomal-protein-alanine N-acetyltransferase
MFFNFIPFPQLATQRLLLQQLSLNDAEELFDVRTNETINKYLDRTVPASIEEVKIFINKINLSIHANQSLFWKVCLKEQPGLIGTICLWNFSKENKAEIGYELLPQFQGKGIMQEAFLKIIEFGFQTLQLTSIEARTVKQNESSIKILERNYFTKDHNLENKIDRDIDGSDMIIFSLSKADFLNNRT